MAYKFPSQLDTILGIKAGRGESNLQRLIVFIQRTLFPRETFEIIVSDST